MENVSMARAYANKVGKDRIAKTLSVRMIVLAMVNVLSNHRTVLDSVFATMGGEVLVASVLLFTLRCRDVRMIARGRACA
jgi:hypothetical protein